MEVPREQIEEMDQNMKKIIKVVHHSFDNEDSLAVNILLGGIILLNLIQLFCQAMYQTHTDISFCKIYE